MSASEKVRAGRVDTCHLDSILMIMLFVMPTTGSFSNLDNKTGSPDEPNVDDFATGDTKCYFPNNNLMKKSTANEIGGSFYAAFIHRGVRLGKAETK